MWMLGLSIMLLGFGGLAVDYWRALALQRELAAVADSAAVAGASGIDEAHYRATGEVILSPSRATDLAHQSVAFQGRPLSDVAVAFSPGGESVTVVVRGEVELGLLQIFIDDDEPLHVEASATAFPLRLP